MAEPTAVRRVGVSLGATGAVGSTILEVLARAQVPGRRGGPLASARSAGSKVDFAGDKLEVQELTEDVDPGPRPDPLLGRRQGRAPSGRRSWIEAGAVVVDNTSYWRMHEDVPLVVAEVNDDAVDRPQRPGRQPQLHDDGADGRAQADPRCGRDRAPDRLHLPVGLRHRPRGDRGAPRAVAGRARGQAGRARRSIRTRSPSTSCPRSRPSRTATTTRPRSAR